MKKLILASLISSFVLIYAQDQKKELNVRVETNSLKNRIDIYITGNEKKQYKENIKENQIEEQNNNFEIKKIDTLKGVKNYTIYIIRRGETLHRIAKKYGVSVDKLIEINNIKDVRDIDVGRELIITPL